MRIKKTSQYIEGGASLSNVYGTSNENGYTQEYINTELNKKLDNTITTQTVSSAIFYKMGNLVIVQGWFVLNGATGSFTAPYKPTSSLWVATNGVSNSVEASTVNGFMSIDANGSISIKMTGAVTYCTGSFAYLTND